MTIGPEERGPTALSREVRASPPILRTVLPSGNGSIFVRVHCSWPVPGKAWEMTGEGGQKKAHNVVCLLPNNVGFVRCSMFSFSQGTTWSLSKGLRDEAPTLSLTLRELTETRIIHRCRKALSIARYREGRGGGGDG